jgi:hypothetical protein
MMARAAVFRQQLTAYIDTTLSPAARSARLATVARTALAELQASGRASRTYRLSVDGRPGASESTVRGDGTGDILYSFSYIADAVEFALDFLRARAPEKTGRYRQSFYVIVGDKFSLASAIDLAGISPTAEIVIGNTQPYNRKVDVQRNGLKPLRFSVPPGEYDDCIAALTQRYGNTMRAKRVFDYNFPGKYRLQNHQTRKSGRRAGKIIRRAGDAGQSPAIVLSPII